jgi:hypothetical protein
LLFHGPALPPKLALSSHPEMALKGQMKNVVQNE